MNSDDDFQPDKVLDAILEQLREESLSRRIDATIDVVLDELLKASGLAEWGRSLEAIVINFMGRLRNLENRSSCTRSRLLAEGMEALNTTFAQGDARGYDAALIVFAQGGHDCLPDILGALAEGIKSADRARFREWVYATCLLSLEWHQRHAVARAFRRRYSGFLPEIIEEMPASRLVPLLPRLIDDQLQVEQQLTGMAISWQAPSV